MILRLLTRIRFNFFTNLFRYSCVMLSTLPLLYLCCSHLTILGSSKSWSEPTIRVPIIPYRAHCCTAVRCTALLPHNIARLTWILSSEQFALCGPSYWIRTFFLFLLWIFSSIGCAVSRLTHIPIQYLHTAQQCVLMSRNLPWCRLPWSKNNSKKKKR